MEFVEALQEFLFHQGFQKIKYDSKILWGKDTGDKLSLLEVVPPLLPGQPRIGLKQREEEMLDIERQIMLKYRKKVEHLLLILNKGEADFEERKEAEKYPDIWFFDIKAGQLYIYEYQKSQYCGLESSLEPFSQKFLQQKITEERTELQHTEQRYRIFTGDNIIDIQNDRHINLRIFDVSIKFRLRIFHLVIVHNGLLPYFPGRRNVVEQAGCNIFHFRIVSSHTYQDHVLLICRIVLIRPRNIINDIPNASPEKNT